MDFNVLSAECAPWVAPQTMAAIVKTESQFNPLAININAGAKLEHQPASKEEAVVTAKWLIANNYNIDLGLGQVNSANLAQTNLSIEDAFDSCKNLAAAATILQWNYASASKKITGEQAALHAAISAYNTGSFTRGFNNGYVQKVLNNASVDGVSGGKRNSVIAPIAVVNRKKTDIAKEKFSMPADSNAVKLTISKDKEEKAFTVYGDSGAEQDVMVYR
jgi:type IV secretion system protein VirB1